MDDNNETIFISAKETKVADSPKPLAFTIDFGEGKVDLQRHESLVEKLRHRRGQSLSKLEHSSVPVKNKNPATENLPRKSSFQSEVYLLSDVKTENLRNVKSTTTGDKMTQSCTLPCFTTPQVEFSNTSTISSPKFNRVSFSLYDEPLLTTEASSLPNVKVDSENAEEAIGAAECDFDKSDSVSDAGTYTLDADNYSEEQKARMSIDREFKIEAISVSKKTEDYIRSLHNQKDSSAKPKTLNENVVQINEERSATVKPQILNLGYKTEHANDIKKEFKTEHIPVLKKAEEYIRNLQNQKNISPKPKNLNDDVHIKEEATAIVKPQTLNLTSKTERTIGLSKEAHKVLSPILSPTQNVSVTHSNSTIEDCKSLNNDESSVKKIFKQIMFPSSKQEKEKSPDAVADHGNIISVTSSGAFRQRSDNKLRNVKNFSLSKSGVHIEAYTGNKFQDEIVVHAALTLNTTSSANLTANVIHVSDNISKSKNNGAVANGNVSGSETVVKENANINKDPSLSPGTINTTTSPTKIPSPIHSFRSRNRSSSTQANIDLTDINFETDSYLKPTQNIIKSLQERLSLDSDQELDTKYLNNDARNLFKKPLHLRHNSFDDRNLKISNKLEHFQSKNLQCIDQTYTNMLNHYKTNKIQNSANNSPIRRSSSFSTKNQNTKNLNVSSKETNILHSSGFGKNDASIQRSVSTTNIKPYYLQGYRSSANTDHQKIDRNAFGDTESSSEEDCGDKNLKKKDITNTRYNRAFSLRRARLESDSTRPKCPNTPEMRRKFHTSESRPERAISVDRKPVKQNQIQSRYLQNVTKKCSPTATSTSTTNKNDVPENVPTIPPKARTNKPPVLSRTDTGRLSMRSASNTPKNLRKDADKKQSGGRSNSSLSSREVEFQNWKRRKSYDPMKAAAEGKRKTELAKRQNSLTQSLTDANKDCDSSPSHSSSVYRSQSFHGTAALEDLVSSDDEDHTLSIDEGFSPPTPSPCELSPARASLKYAWKD